MQSRQWQLRHHRLSIPAGGGIMGILNTTPDSFSDGGQHNALPQALAHAETMLAAGAHIIDIGGESTRPGATPTDIATEIRRTLPVIEALKQRHPEALISIDTHHPEVAEAALNAGADILNDITALEHPDMVKLCAERPCGIILMHHLPFDAPLPAPELMPGLIRQFFEEKLRTLAEAGVAAERICLDPGIGFGKRAEHTVEIIRHLEDTRAGDRPILMALSRKRFIGQLLYGKPEPVLSPLPTAVLSLLSAAHGANLHRVHDVAELRDTLLLRHAVESA